MSLPSGTGGSGTQAVQLPACAKSDCRALRTTDTSRPPDPAKQADASLLPRDDGPIFVQPNRAKTLVCHALEATMRTL